MVELISIALATFVVGVPIAIGLWLLPPAPKWESRSGEKYDLRYWRKVYLGDAPPMVDMGPDYVWDEDYAMERKQPWERDYGKLPE